MTRARFLPLPTDLARWFSYEPETGVIRWAVDGPGAVPIPAGTVAGSIFNSGYRVIVLRGQRIASHRLAWFLATGTDPGDKVVVDHINGDKLDNRLINLRLASRAQNCWNRRSGNQLGKGIHVRGTKFQVRLVVCEKVIHIGRFGTLEEATAARDYAYSKYHGEFARTD